MERRIRFSGGRAFRQQWAFILMSALFVLSGCVRREGRNSECKWPPMPLGNQRDLRADLEFAEELAIRYMDAHYGPRDEKVAAEAKNRCMGILLVEIGKERGMSPQQAFESFGQRSIAADAAMILPFAFLYGLAADFTIRRLLGRYPPGEGWMTSLMVILLVSMAFGAGGLILAQQWSGLAESIRIGTSHLSNRTFRLPINKHPGPTFEFAVLFFLGVAAVRYWIQCKSPLAGSDLKESSSSK